MDINIVDVRAILQWRVRNGDPDKYVEWVEYARKTWPHEDVGFALEGENIDGRRNYRFTPHVDEWVKVGDSWTIKRPDNPAVA